MSLCLGGGGGAGYYKTNPTLDANRSGSIGGSGGGSGLLAGLASGSATGDNSYGNNGGIGTTSGSYNAPHGGGGGASSVGGDGQIVNWDLLDTKVTGLTAGAAFFYKTTYFGDEIKRTVGTGFFQTDMVSGSIRPSGSYTIDDFTIQTFGVTSNNNSAKNGNGGEPLIVDWLSNFYNDGEVGAGGGAGGNGTYGGYDVVNGDGGGNTGGTGQSADGLTPATSGSQFSGAGGGGGFIEGLSPYNVGSGADGGSGIALIRYEGTEAEWQGGEVTISGSHVYHLFTGSAEFTYIQ
jgi:hypothetical protein